VNEAQRGAAGLRAGFRRVGRWLSRTLREPEYPLVAIEVRPRAVAAVRLVREGGHVALGGAAVVEVPEGVLEVSLTRPNIVDSQAFSAVLQTAVERVGALSGGAVSLVLPDPAVRLALVSAEGLKARGPEAEETIRFRLHKALPFDVRAARLAWDGTRGGPALVAVALSEVVGSYEDAVEALGLRPGVVEASTLALASLGEGEDEEGDRLLVNWDDTYVSFLLLRGLKPLLVRTLPGETGAESVARQAASTIQFHRDRLAGAPLQDVVLRSAAVPPAEAAAALVPALGREPRLLRPWAALGDVESDVAAQAVAGAAASALRRVA
jgi:hypothetical protein